LLNLRLKTTNQPTETCYKLLTLASSETGSIRNCMQCLTVSPPRPVTFYANSAVL